MLTWLSSHKIITALVPVLVGLVVSYFVWLTKSSFSKALIENNIQSVSKSVEELKGDFTTFKHDVDHKFEVMQNKIDVKQDRMIDILLRMEKRKDHEEKPIDR